MSLKEFKEWCVYRSKRGSLNLGRRIEQSIGLLSYMFAKANGSKRAKIEDFTPYEAKKKKVENSENEKILNWLENK